MLLMLTLLGAWIGPTHNQMDMIFAYQDLWAEAEAPFTPKPLDINRLNEIMSKIKDAPRIKQPTHLQACINESQCQYFQTKLHCQPGDVAQYSYNAPILGWSVYCLGFDNNNVDNNGDEREESKPADSDKG